MIILPAGAPPMVISKKTRGRAILKEKRVSISDNFNLAGKEVSDCKSGVKTELRDFVGV